MFLSNNVPSLFILYLIISANWLTPLFSCKVRNFIDSSIAARHLLGYLTMSFFVVLANQKSPLPISKLFGISALLYGWFMLSSKMDIYMWVLFMICIGAIYIINIYQNNNEEENKDKLESMKDIITYIAAGTTILGVFLYYGEKRIEYGKQFDTIKFILGNPICKQKTPSISFVEKFSAAVGLK